MSSHFIPPVSIEKFAAYLEGNLSNTEMENMKSVINEDDTLRLILEDVNNIEEPSQTQFDIESEIYPEDALDYRLDDVTLPSLDGDKSDMIAALLDNWIDSDDGENEDEDSEIGYDDYKPSGTEDYTNQFVSDQESSEYDRFEESVGEESDGTTLTDDYNDSDDYIQTQQE